MAYLKVRVSPGAREDAVNGWQGDPSTSPRGGGPASGGGSGQAVLRVRVRAAPERGKANEAVCRLLAARLGLPPASVTLSHGPASRDKLLHIDGLTEEEVRRRLGAPMM